MKIFSLLLLLVSAQVNATIITFNPSDSGYITQNKNGALSEALRSNSLLVGQRDDTLVNNDDIVKSVGVYKFDLRSLQSDWIINSASIFLTIDTTTPHQFGTTLDQARISALWGGDSYNPPEVAQSDFNQNGGFHNAAKIYPSTVGTDPFQALGNLQSTVEVLLNPARTDTNGYFRFVVGPDSSSDFSFGAAIGGMYVTNAYFEINYSEPVNSSTSVPEPTTISLFALGLLGLAYRREKA